MKPKVQIKSLILSRGNKSFADQIYSNVKNQSSWVPPTDLLEDQLGIWTKVFSKYSKKQENPLSKIHNDTIKNIKNEA